MVAALKLSRSFPTSRQSGAAGGLINERQSAALIAAAILYPASRDYFKEVPPTKTTFVFTRCVGYGEKSPQIAVVGAIGLFQVHGERGLGSEAVNLPTSLHRMPRFASPAH